MSRSNPAEALLAQVERLYARAKSGGWEEVWLSLAGERELAAACSRFVKPSSGWTFLHQAAYAGNELAVRGECPDSGVSPAARMGDSGVVGG